MTVRSLALDLLRTGLPTQRRAFLGAFALAGLPGVSRAQAGDTLRIAAATDPSSFDPHFTYFGPNRQAHMPVFEPLAMYGADLSLKPALATRWRAVTPTRWEIELRDGVRFHDGTAFDAEDVVFSLDRAQRIPNSPSTLGVYTRAIKSITAPERLKLVVDTHGTAPLLMQDLANIPIISRRVSAQATTASFDAGQGVIGTGPYRFVEWKRGRSIRYAHNPQHWSGQAPWRNVEVMHMPDGAARVEALLRGDVDFIDQVPPAAMDSLRNRPGIEVMTVPSNFLIFLHMDQFRKVSPHITAKDGSAIPNPLRDVRVRKAISLALDRKDLVERALGGAAEPAAQLLPASFPGTIAGLRDTGRDLVQARALMRDAGLADGFRLVIHGTKGRYTNDVGVIERVAQQLRVIGIETHTESLGSTEFFARASSGLNGEPAFSMILVGWASVEPSGALKGLLATYDQAAGLGSSNRGRYSNREVDALLERGLQTTDDAQRATLLARATRLAVVEEQGIVPLYFPVNAWAGRKGLRFAPRVDASTFPMDVAPA